MIHKPGRGMVAAGHPATAAAGAEILRAGGNAFDAAIAALLTACVTESTLTSLGGAGFLLAAPAQGQPILFDFFSQTPQRRRSPDELDFYPVNVEFGDTTQEFHIGLGTVTVPGVPKGIAQVHRQLGRLPMTELAVPAIHWARSGVTVNPFHAYVIDILAPILTATPGARALYAPDGDTLKAGDTLHLPNLANTLEHLVAVGFDSLYTGDLAQQFVADCAAHGGQLTAQDLQDYQVITRSPLAIAYRDRQVLTNPPPSSGGALIGFTLKLLEAIALTDIPTGSAAYVTHLAEVMALTNRARRDGYDAQLYDPDVASRFLNSTHVQDYSAALAMALEDDFVASHARSNKWGSTTHISVIDGEGNAASVTTSNGEGSSYVLPGTGIMLNNMLGEEDLNPTGFHQWQENQRISSMMAPSLLLKDGRPEVVLGSGGSNRIRTAIAQVIANLIDHDLDLAAAVAAPRLHWERHHLHLEPGLARPLATSPRAQDQLTQWQAPNMFFGGVHAVQIHPNGEFSGAGDQRRNGAIAQA